MAQHYAELQCIVCNYAQLLMYYVTFSIYAFLELISIFCYYDIKTEGGWTSHKAVDISDSIANLLTQTQLTLTRRASQHENQQHTALSG
jgi:hypothetical protein